MNYQTIAHEITLVVEECCACGVPFGMTATTMQNFRRTGDGFYCPNGHRQVYTESVEDKLKKTQKDLAIEKQNTQWWKEEAETKAKELKSTRSELTKTKKRISGGACPCCHRQFVNLKRHMDMQHPSYALESK